MIQNYELYLIFNNQLEEAKIKSEIETIVGFLEETLSAKEVQAENEGMKKFAYPIKKTWSGTYVLINFDLDLEKVKDLVKLEKKLNLNASIFRYIIVNKTEDNKISARHEIRETDIPSHRDFNKGRKDKGCFVSYLNLGTIDYKDKEFLEQFTTPYAKILSSSRTGTRSKYQRKIKKAIKRARHMGLLPFSTKHM